MFDVMSADLEDFDVIVIGAGLSGLVSARDLALKDYKVLIFEAGDRVGGRVLSKDFPGTDVKVDIGGEFYDASAHHETVKELHRQKLSIDGLRYKDSTAWLFHYPGKTVITPAVAHPDFEEEYQRVMTQINEDIGRVNFREGLDQGGVMFLDIPFTEYVRNRCKATTFVEEYLLSEAFTMFQTDPSSLSTLSLLHCLAGFGTPEEILNTRPRMGEPFKKTDYARVDCGLGTLAERIANEFLSLGGAIRFNTPIGSIICEPVPAQGSKRYCAICTRYTYPKCSLHGPRVRVVDGFGKQYRGRGCIVATPLNCIPCFKFDPALPETLQHASEMCNISGDTQKVWLLARNVATDVDCVQSWPHVVHSYVKEVYTELSSSSSLSTPTPTPTPSLPPSISVSVTEAKKEAGEGKEGEIGGFDCQDKAVIDSRDDYDDGGGGGGEEASVGTSSMGSRAVSMVSSTASAKNKDIYKTEVHQQGQGQDGSFLVLRNESKDVYEVEIPRVYRHDYCSTNHPKTFYFSPQAQAQVEAEAEAKVEAARKREEKEEEEESILREKGKKKKKKDKNKDKKSNVPEEAEEGGGEGKERKKEKLDVARKMNTERGGEDKAVPATAAGVNRATSTTTMSREEEELRELRRQKRRQSIIDTKKQRDMQDAAHGLRVLGDADAVIARAHEHEGEGANAKHIRSVVAVLGLKDTLGETGKAAVELLPKHHPSATALGLLSHDWKSDSHFRGGMFALRAGTAHLHAEACTQAQRPWPHTANMIIGGGDVNEWWAGWIEGAVSNGKKSGRAMLHFLNPPVPVANHIERRYDDRELVLEIEAERNERKRVEKEAEKQRVIEEAEQRKKRMFKY